MRILAELPGTEHKEIVVRFRRHPHKQRRLHDVQTVRRGRSNGTTYVGYQYNADTQQRERVSVSGNTEVVNVPERDRKRKRHRQ